MSEIEHLSELARNFSCRKCNSTKAKASVISFTSDEPTMKYLNIQHNDCISVMCKKCGFSEFYDRKTISGFNIFSFR